MLMEHFSHVADIFVNRSKTHFSRSRLEFPTTLSASVCFIGHSHLFSTSRNMAQLHEQKQSITGNNWMYRIIRYPQSLKPRSVAELLYIGSWHTSEMPPNSLLLLYDRLCKENEKYPHQNTPILAIYIWYVRMIISTMHNLYHRTRGSQKYTDFSRRNFYIANHKKDLIPLSAALNEVG